MAVSMETGMTGDEPSATGENGVSPRRSTPPRRSRLRLVVSLLGLVICGALVLLATLSPLPLDTGYGASIERFLRVAHRHGVPGWFEYRELEFAANILMFVPIGFLLALALPRRGVWAVILLVPAFSAGIELFQAEFLSARFASIWDVLANTSGGYGGAIVAVLLRAVVARRDRTIVARALWERGPS
jgi:hypothetical protein